MAVIKPVEIDDFSVPSDTIKINPSYSSSTYGAIPSITMADLTLGNISITNGGYTIGAGGSHANAVWTTTGTTTGHNWSAIGLCG